MYIRAIRIDQADDVTFKILNEILPYRRGPIEIKPTEIALRVKLSEAVVRYNVKKLVSQGYLRVVGKFYEPTDKVLFLKNG